MFFPLMFTCESPSNANSKLQIHHRTIQQNYAVITIFSFCHASFSFISMNFLFFSMLDILCKIAISVSVCVCELLFLRVVRYDTHLSIQSMTYHNNTHTNAHAIYLFSASLKFGERENVPVKHYYFIPKIVSLLYHRTRLAR